MSRWKRGWTQWWHGWGNCLTPGCSNLCQEDEVICPECFLRSVEASYDINRLEQLHETLVIALCPRRHVIHITDIASLPLARCEKCGLTVEI